MTEEFRCTVGLPGDVDSPQSIKGRTVPEGRTALFGEEAVFGHQLFSEQRPQQSLRCGFATRRSTACISTSGVSYSHRNSGKFRIRQPWRRNGIQSPQRLRSLPFVNSQRFTRTSELLSEIDGRPQGIIIECRCTEIGLAGRESALQFIGIGSDDPFGSEFAPAVFETPFHQRPQLFGFVPLPAGQGVARSAVCDHRGIASIAGPVPDVVALGDDRTRNRPVFSIHETGEVAVCVECRSIPDVVSEHWEKRVEEIRLGIRWPK